MSVSVNQLGVDHESQFVGSVVILVAMPLILPVLNVCIRGRISGYIGNFVSQSSRAQASHLVVVPFSYCSLLSVSIAKLVDLQRRVVTTAKIIYLF